MHERCESSEMGVLLESFECRAIFRVLSALVELKFKGKGGSIKAIKINLEQESKE